MSMYQRILKDCFWDLNFTVDDIKNIINSDNTKQCNMLFEKILLNSTDLFQDLEIFDKKQLKILLENYEIPQFNHQYAFRRKNIAEVYFFDKPLLVDELRWLA